MAQATKYIGAGLAAIGLTGAGIGIGSILTILLYYPNMSVTGLEAFGTGVSF